MRTKHTFRLPPDLATKVDRLRRAQGRDAVLGRRSGAGVASLASGADCLEAGLRARLDRMTRQIERLERHVDISNEALAVFVRFWLTSTSLLPLTWLWRLLKMDKGSPDRADHRPEVSQPGPVGRTIAMESSGLALQRSGGTGSPGHGQRQNEADAKRKRVRGPDPRLPIRKKRLHLRGKRACSIGCMICHFLQKPVRSTLGSYVSAIVTTTVICRNVSD